MNRTGSGILAVLMKYFRYRLRSRHRKGRGIHPPFAFELVSKVVYNSEKLNPEGSADSYRRNILKSRESIVLEGYGAGSKKTRGQKRRISSIARFSSVTVKQGHMLSRLVNWYNPAQVLELGTGLGISTAYLAASMRGATLISVEGDTGKAAYASTSLEAAGFSNLKLINDTFAACLPGLLIDLPERSIIFLDGDHRYEPTLSVVNSILDKKLDETLIVLDDIYWSEEMQQAWDNLRGHERISLSVDLFYMGILVCRPGMQKQDYCVTF